MPVYNASPYLAAALDSILGQTYADFEFILIDDGSTDDSGDILREYAARDARLRVMHQENRGLVDALNRGLEIARGEFVARMDADDVSLPDRFARQVEYLARHPHVAVLGGAAQYLSENGPLPRFLRHPCSPAEVRRALQTHSALAHPTVMMRRRPVVQVGGYRGAFVHAEDFDLWLRLANHFDLANLSEPVLLYRLHDSQISMRFAEQQVLSSLAAIAAARIRRETGADPTAGLKRITRVQLEQMGVSEAEIEIALFGDFVFKANHLARVGMSGTALGLAEEMADVDWSPSLRRRVPSELAWIRGKACLADGNRLRGLVWLVRACGSRPSRLTGLLRSLLERSGRKA